MSVEGKRENNSIKVLLLLLLIPSAIPILPGRLKTDAVNAVGRSFSSDRMAGIPRVILWAWERPEDLSFIDAKETGIAFLASTLYLRNGTVTIRPRLQPLKVPPETAMMAVSRIESDASQPVNLPSSQRANVVRAITELTRISGVWAIQVDFDAKASERPFYRDLLNDLRRQLPGSMALSITALASWCLGDNWLSELPVDEAVPMLFRMGPDRQEILSHLEGGGDFRPAVCQQSVGVSMDEPMLKLPGGRRIYFFRPQPWSRAALQKIGQEVRQWK